ncbi:DUF1552 domain-containing protein [Marinagarivorans cellulosilyticus]|uniref:DUF1552 domain-containing protein n=1 Tax=Marinagarivorans cellulosilyticus TaxID=2721545 RepID=A0AAN1WE79_9GAMM|nr:DUF1552 domain-containing protein [Marinagarivorans cellulosilyticus]BCD95962.1 hypothetical protein MARGE09_P0161 [Marinagarivorans cellulosilyticus]
MYKLPRRELLKSAAGSLLLAPLLRSRNLFAQNNQPKRFVIFNAAGSFVPQWFPTNPGRNYNLRRPNTAFEPLKDDCIFLQNMRHSTSRGNHHERGMVTAYSAAGSDDGDITLDQVIARSLRGQADAAPIEYIAQGLYGGRNNDMRSLMTYTGPRRRIDPEESARANYNRIFNGASPTTVTGAQSNSLDQRLKCFDVAKEDLTKIQSYLGYDERAKLEQHIDSLLTLSNELKANIEPPSQVRICEDIELFGDRNTVREEQSLVNGVTNLMNLTSAAFQCDRTRVMTMQVGFSGDHYNRLRGFRAGTMTRDSWHDHIHHQASSTNHRYYGEWMWMCELWSEKLAGLANSLKAIPEGDGTMLDNTIILWGSEMGIAHSHSPDNVPHLVIGGRNMGVDSGQYIDFGRGNRQDHAKLLTSIKHAFGIMDNGMGNRPNSGPLAGILR